MKITFNSLGIITGTVFNDEPLRQGNVGNTLEAIFEDKNNVNYSATFTYTRSDEEVISNVYMNRGSGTNNYKYTFNDAWFFEKAGTTTLTIYLKQDGLTIASGQVQFNIEESDVEGDTTITPEQYDTLLETLTELDNAKLDVVKGIIVVNDISSEDYSDYEDGQMLYDKKSRYLYINSIDDELFVKYAPCIYIESENTSGTISQFETLYRKMFLNRVEDLKVVYNDEIYLFTGIKDTGDWLFVAPTLYNEQTATGYYISQKVIWIDNANGNWQQTNTPERTKFYSTTQTDAKISDESSAIRNGTKTFTYASFVKGSGYFKFNASGTSFSVVDTATDVAYTLFDVSTFYLGDGNFSGHFDNVKVGGYLTDGANSISIGEIVNKLDKVSTSGSFVRVYGVDTSGNQQMYYVSNIPIAQAVPQYDSYGRFKVGTPDANTDVANKQYVDTAISNAISNVYQFQGSKTVAQINALTISDVQNGYVYNVSDSGTITIGSLEVNAGDNVVALIVEGSLLWDKLAGEIDLSDYYTKSEVDTALGGKVSISTSGANIVYGRTTTETTFGVGQGASAYKLVQRTSTGQVNVPETPTANEHATSKKYVDDAISATQLASNCVPLSRTIAGVDLQDNITAQELTDALVFANTTTDIDYVMGD